jgi:hypothetical protein
VPAEVNYEKEIERIVEGPGTKADRARALFALGCDRTDVVDLLSMNYSQAHSILKALQNGTSLAPREKQAPHGRQSSLRQVRDEPEADRRSPGPTASVRVRGRGHLRLSPTQVRVLTQDGHRVVKDDYDSGALCRNCKRPLTFSLAWLGFVHTQSRKDPTNVEDRYELL